MDRTTRQARYRDRVAQAGIQQIKQQIVVWRECHRCKRNTRHVAGRCAECVERDNPDYRELPY